MARAPWTFHASGRPCASTPHVQEVAQRRSALWRDDDLPAHVEDIRTAVWMVMTVAQGLHEVRLNPSTQRT